MTSSWLQFQADDCAALEGLDEADYIISLGGDGVEVVLRRNASEASLMHAFVQAAAAAALLNNGQVKPTGCLHCALASMA